MAGVDDDDVDELMAEDDEELVTAGEVLQKLQKAWINEKIAPELLFPLTEEVECMMDQLKNMEDNLSRCQPKSENVVKHHKMEIERIRYLVASYLRTRLAKIQKYAWFIWHQENEDRGETDSSRLMVEEHKFLKEYLQVVEGHLTNVGLTHMPQVSQKLPQKELIKIAPNLDSFVFLRVNRAADVMVENTEGTNEDIIPIKKDAQYIMKYRPLGPLIREEVVQLV